MHGPGKISSAFLLLMLGSSVAKLPLPSYLSKCSSKDRATLNACAVENARSMITAVGAKGDRKYEIPPVNPSQILKISSEQNGLLLEFINITINANPGYTIDDVDMDLEARHFKIKYSTPVVTMSSVYRSDGRLLLLSLKGSGTCQFTFENYKAVYDTDYDIEKNSKDGDEYIKLKNSVIDASIGKGTYQFDNLFNGDATLGKATNEFLNENWKEVFDETKSGTLEAIQLYVTTSLQNFFDKIPYKDLF